MTFLGIVLFFAIQQSHHPMGFDEQKSTHHFILTASGGYIDVSAKDVKDSSMRSEIQSHLKHIAVMFKEGNFEIPMLVHGESPAGVPALKKLKDRIAYAYRPAGNGGRITITSKDRDALAAIHDFLRYQIKEHKTGDSLTVK